MKIVTPRWYLQDRRCPCFCGGEGELEFRACPACGAVMLVCTEVGAVFDDPQAAMRGELKAAGHGLFGDCPRCQSAPIETFRTAQSDEIRALGFRPGEYG